VFCEGFSLHRFGGEAWGTLINNGKSWLHGDGVVEWDASDRLSRCISNERLTAKAKLHGREWVETSTIRRPGSFDETLSARVGRGEASRSRAVKRFPETTCIAFFWWGKYETMLAPRFRSLETYQRFLEDVPNTRKSVLEIGRRFGATTNSRPRNEAAIPSVFDSASIREQGTTHILRSW